MANFPSKTLDLEEYSLAAVLRCSPCSSTASPRTLDRIVHPAPMALSQVRGTNGRCRTIHSSTTSTSFSTGPSHSCMNSLTHTSQWRRASERLAEVCLRYTQTSSSSPRLSLLRPSTPLYPGASAPSAPALTTHANFYTPYWLHSICIRPASAAPAASF